MERLGLEHTAIEALGGTCTPAQFMRLQEMAREKGYQLNLTMPADASEEEMLAVMDFMDECKRL